MLLFECAESDLPRYVIGEVTKPVNDESIFSCFLVFIGQSLCDVDTRWSCVAYRCVSHVLPWYNLCRST